MLSSKQFCWISFLNKRLSEVESALLYRLCKVRDMEGPYLENQ